MPKVTLEFHLPDEAYEFETASKAMEWRTVANELAVFLRDKLKYGHKYKDADEVLYAVRDEFWNSCEAHSVDPLD